MADISHISIPSFNIDGDINDTIARITINNHVADKNNPHNVTKAQVGLGNVDNTSDMDKPISTAVQKALDKKADNTLATESSPGLMSAEDKKAVDREFFKLVPRGATYVPHGADLNDNQYFKVGTYYHDWKPSEKEEERGIIYGMPGAGLHESPLAGAPFIMYVMAPFSDKYDDESTADEMTLTRQRIMIVDGRNNYDDGPNEGGPIYIEGAFNRYRVVPDKPGELNEQDWFSGGWIAIATELDIYFLKQYINKHIYNKSNPHGVTKDQVGLGNVDNTADKDKSVKYANKAGYADYANHAYNAGYADTANHVSWGNVSGKPSTYPPSSHTHTKDQVGLDNVDNTADKDKSVKYAESAGTANSVAWDNVTGKPTTIASSVAWDDVTDKPSTYPPSSHTHTPDQVGLGNVANLDQSKAIKSITRSGTTFTATALDGTTTTFTQQDADTTSVTWDDITDKPSTYPPDAHTHTPDQVGLGNVDNTADIDKPISTAVQKALDGKANTSVATSSTDGLMSKSDKAKLDSIEAGSNVESVNGKTGIVNLSKTDVGLSNVDNTADKDKSVKYAESAGTANSVAWDNVTGKPTTIASSVAWDDVTDKPSTYPPSSHTHTPDQVGLGNVDNTSDANKPISTAVQKALDGKVTKNNTADTNGLLNSLASEEITPTDADYYISQHAGGGTTTTTYHRRPMSALWAFIKSKCDSIYATVSALNTHISNKSNPHNVTKAQVGLGNVDNTSDANKPISTAVQKALDGKANTSVATSSADGLMSKSDKAKLDGLKAGGNVESVNGKTGAVTLTKTDIGLGNVDNTADKDKSVKYAESAGTANSVAWGNVSGKPSSYPPSSHTHTPAQVGLGNVDNTADKDKSVKYATSAGSAGSVAWGNVSGKPSTYPPSSHTHGLATQSADGLMSASDKTKIDDINLGDTAIKATRNVSQSTSTSGYWSAMVNSDSTGSPTTPTARRWWHILSMDWNDDLKNWVSQLAIATQDGDGVWWRRNDSPGRDDISSSTWHRLAEGDSYGAAISAKYAESAGTANSVAWGNVSGKPSTYPPSSHTHSYLPLSGGTVTGALAVNGKLTAAGRLIAPTKGGAIVAGKDVNNAVLGLSTQAAFPGCRWDPIIAQKDYAGGTWNMGSMGNQVGFAGFYKNRTENGYDWYHYVDTTDGTVHFGAMVYANVSGNASTANIINSNQKNIVYGDGHLQYNYISGNVGNDPKAVQNPTNDWYYHIIMNHANPDGYYGDIALCFHSNDLRYRRVTNGSDNGWVRVIDSANIGSQSVNYANSAGTATKATKDSSGQQINTTYIKDVRFSNGSLIYKRGDGNTVQELNAILDSTYPVGSIYMSMNSTSPASLFGGTWLPITNKFLFASGSVYAAGEIGGEYSHTLTMGEVIQHGMWISDPATQYNSQIDLNFNPGSLYGLRTYNQSAVSHNNMPPYLVVYMWRRTA